MTYLVIQRRSSGQDHRPKRELEQRVVKAVHTLVDKVSRMNQGRAEDRATATI